jgi:hypothetical protein
MEWDGNARALFLGSRVFGLTGAELVEGRIDGPALREARRVNLTAPRAADGR